MVLARCVPFAASTVVGKHYRLGSYNSGQLHLLAPIHRLGSAAHAVTDSRDQSTEAAAAAAPAAQACPTSPEPSTEPPSIAAADTDDERFMQLAYEQAQLAFADGEVPVGAVLVSAGGEILARAHNTTEASRDPTAHAEMLCIRQAAQRKEAWRLLDATLYVTLEPCPMCAGALLQSRVGTVVYGARNNLLGADGSWIAMLPQGNGSACTCGKPKNGGNGSSQAAAEQHASDASFAAAVQATQPVKPHPFHPNMVVRRGVLAEQCGSLMRLFFAERRKQGATTQSAELDTLSPPLSPPPSV